jgi:two-component system, chemotaxis family, CheB/CheR fusion protein
MRSQFEAREDEAGALAQKSVLDPIPPRHRSSEPRPREPGMDTLPIVAVASSAGDLEAVCELLSALSAECGAAFVIVQTLDSGRERLLARTLADRTILPVVPARDAMLAEPGHVYVITANTTVTTTRGRIRVAPKASGLHHPGDILFASLAEERGDGAIGVILSGEGYDGALGARAIQQRGGTTFAQYPGSARFPGMPISAIETGCVDFVLRPNEIARELTRLAATLLGSSIAKLGTGHYYASVSIPAGSSGQR